MINYIYQIFKDAFMKFRSYRFISRASFYLFLAYLLSFVLYYVATFIHPTDVLTYIWLFAERATYLLFPTISAVLTLIVFVYCGAYKGAVAAIPLSLTRLVYLIPDTNNICRHIWTNRIISFTKYSFYIRPLCRH